jgi:hypothetical protein
MNRTVQFLVERRCPESDRAIEAEKVGFFPCVIWVFWPPVPNLTYGCSASVVYRHDPTTPIPGPKEITHPGGYVCEHMGHLIE